MLGDSRRSNSRNCAATVPAVGIAVRMNGAIFLPQDHQGDARPLQLPRDRCPVRFDVAAGSSPHTAVDEQPTLQLLVGDFGRQWPRDPRRCDARQIFAHRAV
jgi:hypothetical protein